MLRIDRIVIGNPRNQICVAIKIPKAVIKLSPKIENAIYFRFRSNAIIPEDKPKENANIPKIPITTYSKLTPLTYPQP